MLFSVFFDSDIRVTGLVSDFKWQPNSEGAHTIQNQVDYAKHASYLLKVTKYV